MVPIHYFLALFFILVSLMGCTQNVPPGSRQNATSHNTTGLVETRTDDPKQTFHRGGNSTVKPSTGSELAPFSLESPNAGEWRLNFAGEDAEILYQLMEAAPSKMKKDNVLMLLKNGIQFSCLRTKKTHTCTMAMDSSNGQIEKVTQSEEINSFDADLVLTEKYTSSYFELDPPTASLGKFGRLAILGDNAKKIYEALSMTAVPLNDRQDRFGKKGKNMACYQETLGDAKEPSFACRFFFNYDTGTFDEIQVLN